MMLARKLKDPQKILTEQSRESTFCCNQTGIGRNETSTGATVSPINAPTHFP